MTMALNGEYTRLSHEEVLARQDKFAESIGPLSWFWQEARVRRGQQPNNPMQEPPQIARFRALAAQILEERTRTQQQSEELF